MNRRCLALALCAIIAWGTTLLFAQEPARKDAALASANWWSPIGFLLGDWTGQGSGGPGQGTGGFSFRLDLQNQVIIRTNRAEHPATKDRPAFSHEDLMLVYRDPATTKLRAFYVDSEGHVIHYVVEAIPEAKAVRFLSEASASAPRYRLTYSAKSEREVSIKFEIAPPGQPESFSTYIEATARKNSGK